MINGVIAAVARAAIDHQRVPCELVCPASRSGRVGASAPARTTAKKYSFQEKTRERMNAATNPEQRWEPRCAETPARSSAIDQSRLFELDGDRIELIAHDPDHDRQVHDRVNQDETGAGVQEVQLPIQDKDRQSDRHRRRISCERNQNEMSLFRHGPKR